MNKFLEALGFQNPIIKADKVDLDNIKLTIRDLNDKLHTLIVPASGYLAWKEGKNIQRALPNLTAEQRELMMTGMTDEMFNDTFKEEE